MSVLFKALQKAEKTRAESDEAAQGYTSAASYPASARPKGRSAGRIVARSLAVGVVVVGGLLGAAVVAFPDEAEMMLADMMDSSAPPPARVTFTPRARTETDRPAMAALPAPAEPPASPPQTSAVTVPAASPAVAAEATPEPVPTVAVLPEASLPVEQAVDGQTALGPLLAMARQAKDNQDAVAEAARKQRTLGEVAAEAQAGSASDPVPDTAPVELAALAPVRAPASATSPAPVSLERALAQQNAAADAVVVRPAVTVGGTDAPATLAAGQIQVSLPDPGARDLSRDGYAALMRGDYHRALDLYDAALATQPRSGRALSGRAAALHKLRRLDEARHAYERVLAVSPGNREALTNLVALTAGDNPASALEGLQRLERQAPDFSPVLAQIGLLLADRGAVADAMPYLLRAASLEPTNPLYRYNLAVVLDTAGRAADAATAYRSALDLSAGGQGTMLGVPISAVESRLRYLTSASQGQ